MVTSARVRRASAARGRAASPGPRRSVSAPRAQWRPAILLLLAAVLLAGCASGPIATSSASPTPSPTATPTPTPTAAPTPIPTATPNPSLDQQIDAYIATLSPAQLIGQTLMLSVYANGYNSQLNTALAKYDLGSAIVFTNYNGGPTEPTTLPACSSSTGG